MVEQFQQKDSEPDFYLPQPLIMLVTSFMSHYELCKMRQANAYLRACAQACFKQLCLSAGLQTSREDAAEEAPDWMAMYARATTRKAFALSSALRLNPHEPETAKDLIARPLPTTFGRRLDSVYQGGKLAACLSVDGELIVTAAPDLPAGQFQELKQLAAAAETLVVPHEVA